LAVLAIFITHGSVYFLREDFFLDDFFAADFFLAVFLPVDLFFAAFFLADFFLAVFFAGDLLFFAGLLRGELLRFVAVFFAGDLLFFAAFFFEAVFFLGTFAPDLRASLNPIAMACLRLVTFFPLPDRSLPRFFSRITFSTFFCAPFEYFAMIIHLSLSINIYASMGGWRMGQLPE